MFTKFDVLYIKWRCAMDDDVGKFSATGMFFLGLDYQEIVLRKRYGFIFKFDATFPFQNEKCFVETVIYLPGILTVAKMYNGTIDRERIPAFAIFVDFHTECFFYQNIFLREFHTYCLESSFVKDLSKFFRLLFFLKKPKVYHRYIRIYTICYKGFKVGIQSKQS